MCTDFLNMPTNRAVRYAQFHFYMRNDKTDWAGKDIATAFAYLRFILSHNNLSIHQLKTIIYEK